MKKISMTASSLLICATIQAQTLTQSTHAPAVGDVYSFQYADSTTLPSNLGNPGAGNTFNFSGLSVHSTINNSQGVTVASTGSTTTYPSANVAVKTGTNYTFYNSQSNKLEFYGGSITVGGYPVTITYTTPAVLGTYPMTLGTTSSGTVAGNINALSNNGTFTGTSSFTADATGTLIVPGGSTYTNVIRVQTHQNITFTFAFISGTLTVNQYDYYAPSYSNYPNSNNNWPVLTVQQSTISSPMTGISTQTIVTINSNYQVLNAPSLSTLTTPEIRIVPNPVKNDIYIITQNNPSIKKIILMDMAGKILYETKNTHINCSLFSNGNYLIRVDYEDGKTHTEKIVIQH